MSFKKSSPQIYAKMQVKGVNREWMERDVFKKLSKFAGMGFSWDTGTMSLKKFGPQTMALDTPWCHATPDSTKNCNFDHHLIFNTFGIIPPRCLACWKVVATPETFEDLMEMEDLQKQMSWPCKCGIELRDYTPKHYGAYFYNNTLEEGRDKYEQVKQIVSDHMTNGKVIADSLILKRGCTEFEMIKGPSPYWHITDGELEMFNLAQQYVDLPMNNTKQTDIMKNNVRQNWILWAHSHGDFTYKKWNDGQDLFPGYVSYHEGDIEGIKKEVQMAVESVQPTEDLRMPEYAEETIGEHDETT